MLVDEMPEEHAEHWMENSVIDYGQWHLPKTYFGHKVLRVFPRTEIQRDFLHQVQRDGTCEVDFWSQIGPVNASVDIRVSPLYRETFEEMLYEAGLAPVVIVEDVQRLIDRERRENMYESRFRRSLESRRDFKLNKYHPLHEIDEFENDLLSKYPGILSRDVIGNSTEGRLLKVLRIGSGRRGAEGYVKPGIWIDGGAHAREWISPATVLYMISQLLVYSQTDIDIKYLVDNIDWYFLTVANPDGYHYSWTTDRMWRKTRSRHILSRDCYGVDPNRNFDYHWGEKGTSNNPCSQLYRGPHAGSEPEVSSITSYVDERRDSITCFMSFHANGQLWMLPWAYTRDLPPLYDKMFNLATKALRALTAQHGTVFLAGSVANIIYEASGSSADWAHGEAEIPYTYGIELRDFGHHGFMLPASQIIPGGEEAWAAVRVIAEELVEESLEEERQRRREEDNARDEEQEVVLDTEEVQREDIREVQSDGGESIDGLLLISEDASFPVEEVVLEAVGVTSASTVERGEEDDGEDSEREK